MAIDASENICKADPNFRAELQPKYGIFSSKLEKVS